MSENFKQCLPVLCGALIAGFLCVLPAVLAPQALGNEYRGIPFFYLNNEEYYLARMQEIADGHASVASPVFYEYKDRPAMVPPIGEFLYVSMAKMLGISFASAIVLAKFLFPALLFLLVYFLVCKLMEGMSRGIATLAALSAALLVVLGYDFVDVHRTLAVVTDSLHDTQLSLWTRPVNPITGALFLFGYLLMLWKLFKKPSVPIAIGAGLLAGACIGYIFAWAIALTVLCLLIVYVLIRKEWLTLRYFLITVLSIVVVDGVYVLGMAKAGEDARAAVMNGLILTHAPIINKVATLTIVLFIIGLVTLYRKSTVQKILEEKWIVFSLALAATSIVVFSQQLITGRTIWPYHFVQYTIPISYIVLSVVYFRMIHKKPWLLYLSSALVIGACLFYGIASVRSYSYSMGHFRAMQDYTPVLDYLSLHAPKDSVVLADEPKEEFMRLVPAFTRSNVYLSGYLGAVPPEERLYHNFLVKMKLEGVTALGAREYLESHEVDVREYFFTDWNHLFRRERDPQSTMRIEELLQRYKMFIKNDFGEELKKYRIDYFVTTRPFDLRLLRSLKPVEVFRFGDLTVYALQSSASISSIE